jgi:hypothetical protein
MSHQALNGEQFADHVHPHQLAIPGMEEHAHPFATHVARGYMLDFNSSRYQHHLAAVDVSHPKYPTVAAELDWTRPKDADYEPGEVAMVENFQRGHHAIGKQEPRAKGLAGALFHSAHYWDFGQETVPIHSPNRTDEGEHFSQKVRPDLRPDVRYDSAGRGRGDIIPEGKPPNEGPIWPNVGPQFHPFQREKAAAQQAESAKARASVAAKASGQGQLFYRKKGS